MSAAAIEARTIRTESGRYLFAPGRGLVPAERDAAERRIAQMGDRLDHLVPDDGGTVVEDVAEQVYANFSARDDGGTRETIYDGYLIALPGRSALAVREAVRRILRAEAPARFSRVFVPRPGELAELAQLIEAEWKLEADRLRRLLVMEEAGRRAAEPEPEISAADREKLTAHRAAMMAALQAPGNDRPAHARMDGVSPAARVAAMTAARKAERLRQAEQPENVGNVLSEEGQLFSETGEQEGSAP